MTSLTFETAVMAISKVAVTYEVSELEAITIMQAAAAKANDEKSLEILCDIKSTLILKQYAKA